MRRLLRRAIALVCVASSTALPARAECFRGRALTFGPQTVVDPARSGADPAIVRLPSGDLVMTAQPFVQRTSGQPDPGFVASLAPQSPVWRSTDGGSSWMRFVVPRVWPGAFDPDLSADAEGSLYIAERNGATTSVSASTDGDVWVPRTPAAAVNADRPWLAADLDVLYLSADQAPRRTLYRSTDAGLTFHMAAELPGGFSRPVVGPTGAVHASFSRFGAGPSPGQMIAVASYAHARTGDFTRRIATILAGRENIDQDAAGVDASGNIYVTWTQRPTIPYPGGVWYAYSTDGGATFSSPVRVDTDNAELDLTVTMPAVVAAAGGHAAIVWLQSSRSYRKDDPESWPAALWRVRVAVSSDAAGCEGEAPHWAVSTATNAVHQGPMCGGLLCDLANRNDSRAGRFLAGTTRADGRLVIAYPDTMGPGSPAGRPSAVAHPGVVVSNESL